MGASAKSQLRQQVQARLRALAAPMRAAAATRICEGVRHQACWQGAGSVLLFAALPDEPDLRPLLAEGLRSGKAIALPQYDPATRQYRAARIEDPGTDLVSGRFGIAEPGPICALLPVNRLDLILLPGVAFDLHGGRLGRGQGYYDQLLAGVGATKCGVAFDEQIVEGIPREPHDVLVNCIVTPTRWIEV